MLHLLHLVSPALPVGAYAYSQGLEYAIDSGWLKTDDDIEDWLSEVMSRSLGYLDVPMLRRFYLAWQQGDSERVQELNRQVRACRETRELLLEDEQLGMALNRLLVSLGVAAARESNLELPPCFVSQFALAGVHWNIPLDDLAEGFVWSWLENQVAAATKIVPLGQTHAQQLLLRVLPRITQVCTLARDLPDEDIGLSLPGVAMASSLHERQYSRLFRS